MKLRLFQGLIPSSNDAAKELCCPPYDVVSDQEAKAYLKDRPNSFLSVIRPDAQMSEVSCNYQRAYTALCGHVESGRLCRPRVPALYVYEQIEPCGHTQQGVVGLVQVSDYESGTIKRHEHTRPDKVEDRARLAETLSAQTGPVFLTYEDEASVQKALQDAVNGEPLFNIQADDGVNHRVWSLTGTAAAAVQSAFEAVEVAYIADGHHRAASACAVSAKLMKRESSCGESHARENKLARWFLAALFPRTHLRILPYFRVVRDLNGMHPPLFFEALCDQGISVKKLQKSRSASEASTKGVVHMCLRPAPSAEPEWYVLQLPMLPGESKSTKALRLDYSVLQDTVLSPILGITDARTNTRISFVGGVRGLEELERAVTSGYDVVAFAPAAVDVMEIMSICDAGEIMPPKSSWFEPKLRSGFFVHTF